MHDRALAPGLAGMLLGATMTIGDAAERMPTVAFGIDGSLPLAYSDDRFKNPAGRADYSPRPICGFRSTAS